MWFEGPRIPSPKIGPVEYGQRWERWKVSGGSFELAKALVGGLAATPTSDLPSSCPVTYRRS